jgi:hypothetical protein
LSSRWSVNLIVFLKAKGYPLKALLKRTIGLLLQEKFLFGISAFGIFRNDFASGLLVSGELLVSPTCSESFPVCPFLQFFFSLSVFLCFFVLSLLLWSVASQ